MECMFLKVTLFRLKRCYYSIVEAAIVKCDSLLMLSDVE